MVGIAVAAIVVGFPLAMYLLQDKLIFLPQPVSEAQRAQMAQRQAGAKSVFLTARDGTRLHAWHVEGAPDSPLVLYFGGNAENVAWMAEEAAREAPGIGWLLVDYRGYGSSGGTPSEAAFAADALAWHAYAMETLRPKRTVLFGRSLGSGVAVRLASERPVDGVILVAPFDSLVEVARRHYPFLPVGLLLKHRFESARLAPQMAMPLLCLAAMSDDIVPPRHAKRLCDAWGGPKQWVALDGAGHNSTDSHPNYWRSIRAFLAGS